MIRRQIDPGTDETVNAVPNGIGEIQDAAVEGRFYDDVIDENYTCFAMGRGDAAPRAARYEFVTLTSVQGLISFREGRVIRVRTNVSDFLGAAFSCLHIFAHMLRQ